MVILVDPAGVIGREGKKVPKHSMGGYLETHRNPE